MPDEPRQYGHGALRSPDDERDYVLTSELLERVAGASPLPASYRVPSRPPITDQGFSPMCVAYSAAYEQNEQDEREHGRFYDFDEARFFYSIGGNANGAYMRAALDRMRIYGYPEQDSTPSADKHRIAAYYAVPLNMTDVRRAIYHFGGVLMIGQWYDSWTHPQGTRAILPNAGGSMAGHAWWACGWTDDGYIIGQQTWGRYWGNGGLFLMSWGQLSSHMWEAWKTLDEKTVSTIAKARIESQQVQIRTTEVLGADGHLKGTIFAKTSPAGIRRIRDGKIIDSPWNKPFPFKGFRDGAKHGIEPYPRKWAVIEVNGINRCVAKPLVKLVY